MPFTPATPDDIARTLSAARLAQTRAYAPYSHFRVGAALLTTDGQIIMGCNVETATNEEHNCAERSAVASALTSGAGRQRRFIKLVAVKTEIMATADNFHVSSPCGACRQVISDFALGDKTLMVLDDGKDGLNYTLADFFPRPFILGKEDDNASICNMQELEAAAAANPTPANLTAIAKAIRNNAAAHVTGKAEGAVIIATNGKAYAGVTVENSSTGLTMRALRGAIARAVADGAAANGPAFIKHIALHLPERLSLAADYQSALNPSLLCEFTRADTVTTISRDGVG